jgi:hypothetical protein
MNGGPKNSLSDLRNAQSLGLFGVGPGPVRRAARALRPTPISAPKIVD